MAQSWIKLATFLRDKFKLALCRHCSLRLSLQTTTSTCKCKKTFIACLLRELEELKVGKIREIL